MASVLVVGGAGYVGSAVSAHLQDRGDTVWVLDDLSTGHRSLVLDEIHHGGRFIEARAGDSTVLDDLFRHQKFEAVFHFAAKSQVSESVRMPEIYFENNVEQTRLLLEAMAKHGVGKFIFSSTASVYGDPGDQPADFVLSEDFPKRPMNPYGETKLAVEQMLADRAKRVGFQAIALRYFNAAGAEAGLRVGEHHEPETHLLPNLLGAAIEGRPISIFGNDYPTRDGTCVRDYVHIEDLAAAHAAAADRMVGSGRKASGFEAYNLGSENGFTVKEVIDAAERELGLRIDREFKPRRQGDPAKLVASAARARSALGFAPRTDALPAVLRSAYAWELKKRAPKRAVFLDRDGTINLDPGYLNDAAKLELLPGAAEGLRELQDAGYLLIVVSNQSGIARGKISMPELRAVHRRMDELLSTQGVRIHHYALCFHHPDADCECRKPKSKLVVDAARTYGIDLARSYMVGDKSSDVACGRTAGVRESFLVGTGYGAEDVKLFSGSTDAFFVSDLRTAARRIVANGH